MTPAFLFAFLCQAILPLWKCLERVSSVQSALGGPGSGASRDSTPWIPASAGMTAHRGQASPCLCQPSGRAEGRSPFAFFPSPKTERSPQEDGGQGVESEFVSQPEESGLVLRKR